METSIDNKSFDTTEHVVEPIKKMNPIFLCGVLPRADVTILPLEKQTDTGYIFRNIAKGREDAAISWLDMHLETILIPQGKTNFVLWEAVKKNLNKIVNYLLEKGAVTPEKVAEQRDEWEWVNLGTEIRNQQYIDEFGLQG